MAYFDTVQQDAERVLTTAERCDSVMLTLSTWQQHSSAKDSIVSSILHAVAAWHSSVHDSACAGSIPQLSTAHHRLARPPSSGPDMAKKTRPARLCEYRTSHSKD
eukprot:3520879-Rhodomonas_salina.4